MNIYEKLSAITAELTAVAKNLTVGEGRSSYKAVGEADVLAAVKPLESKYGIYSYPAARRVIDTNIMTVSKTYNGNTTETQKIFLRIETVYRFVNVGKPDEFVEITTYGDGVDAQDKAPGKAMTYGDKYALLKAYKIITGDDPDQKMSEEGTFEKKEEKPKTSDKYKPNVYDRNATLIGMIIKLVGDERICNAAAYKRYGKVLDQLGTAELEAILKELNEGANQGA